MRKIFHTLVMLRHFCEPDSTWQYIRATQDFVMLDGLNPVFIDSSGLTQAAVQCFDRIITGKIKCSKL